ncbi:MAG: HAMP domain-containing histidine kinase [Gammaproteobacteria bacterium]|nr:HAMP domain-containing histidine kinase [Gammaproteobacteria bacterium]
MKISIRLRLMISLLTVMGVALWLTAVVIIKDADENMDEHHKSMALHHAKILAEGSIDALVAENYELMNRGVSLSLPEDGYAYAALVRPEGEVLAHTDLPEVGKKMVTEAKPVVQVTKRSMYQQRPVTEVVSSAVSGNTHLANAHVAYYMDFSHDHDEEKLYRLMAIMLMASLLLMAGVYIIADKIIRPIRQLTRAAADFTLEQGVRFSPHIFNRQDEIGELARSFDAMSSHLVKSFEALKVARDDALSAKQKAEFANKAKSEFIANISHELRTPMHAILGYSELGENKVACSVSESEYFSMIRKSGIRLMVLIDKLLDLSKLETGGYEVFYEMHNLKTLTDSCCDESTVLLQEKQLVVSVQSDVEALAEFDLKGIYTVIMSLLANAAKFSEASSKVEIIIKKDVINELSIHFQIQNKGPLIPDDEVSNIFDSFVQSSETKDGAGGAGLGLSVSKKIILAHHGNIWAENAKDQTGVIFHFTLPLMQPQ